MYCSHCGKELAETAIVCPNCGTPTSALAVKELKRQTNLFEGKNPAEDTDLSDVTNSECVTRASGRPLIMSGFLLALISFAISMVWIISALALNYGTAFLISVLTLSIWVTVLPAMVSLVLSICGMCKNLTWGEKINAIISISIAGFVLLFFVITMSVALFAGI